MRTTLDIDDPILRDLKRLQQREGKSLGRLVSDLLAQSLAAQRLGRPVAAHNTPARPGSCAAAGRRRDACQPAGLA
jgi:hypothetical protein